MARLFFMFLFIGFSLPVFSQDTFELWKALNDTTLPFKAFDFAYRGLLKAKPKNPDILSIIDFTKPSHEKRFYIIDLKNRKILVKTYVAHGKNSGWDYAVSFSNTSKSLKSSVGFYLTGETYYGKHGYSLRLYGLEPGINDNAYKRTIVIHGAWYVSEDFISKYGRLGRSWGCPAVPEDLAKTIIDYIKDGTLLFIYSNDSTYWQKTLFKPKSNIE